MGVLGNFAFVLVRPLQAGNVGSAARALKNMGLGDLRLVAPSAAAGGTAIWSDPQNDRYAGNLNTEQRAVLTFKGNNAGWDYQTSLNYSQNKNDNRGSFLRRNTRMNSNNLDSNSVEKVRSKLIATAGAPLDAPE